jgi:hypothetical protein
MSSTDVRTAECRGTMYRIGRLKGHLHMKIIGSDAFRALIEQSADWIQLSNVVIP